MNLAWRCSTPVGFGDKDAALRIDDNVIAPKPLRNSLACSALAPAQDRMVATGGNESSVWCKVLPITFLRIGQPLGSLSIGRDSICFALAYVVKEKLPLGIGRRPFGKRIALAYQFPFLSWDENFL